MATTLPPAPPAPVERRRLSGGRRVLLAVGGAGVAVVLAWSVVSQVEALGRTSYERSTTLDPLASRLTVRTDSGSIELRPSSDGRVRVDAEVRYGLSEPEVVTESTRDGVRVDGRCGGLSLFNCTVDLVVSVPPDFEVTAHSNADDVVARDISGDVRLRSSAGSVTVDGATGRLSVSSSAGGVRARNLRAEVVDAESTAGDVTLAFVAAPRTVRADSAAGDVRVALPLDGGPYAVDARTSAGDTRVTVPTDPTSSRRIEAHSSAGDVRVVPTT